MASSLNITPPKEIDFLNDPKKSFARFEQAYGFYITALDLDGASNKRKSAILLSAAGPEAIKIYNTFEWQPERGTLGEEGYVAGEDKEDPVLILKKLKEFCSPRTNLTYERYLFNRYMQGENESFEEFYANIVSLISTCECNTLRDELLRDKIVVGINNERLRARLLRNSELTLHGALNACRAEEASGKWIKLIGEGKEVNSIGRGQGRPHGSPSRGYAPTHRNRGCRSGITGGRQNTGSQVCGKCGKEPHDFKLCPARNSMCNKCKRQGHWGLMCRFKAGRVQAIDDTPERSQSDPRFFEDYEHQYADFDA